MTYKSMLAHIVPRLTNQVENVATDALLYLIRRYPVASKAFISYVSNLGVLLSDNLNFDIQIGLMGGAIPDLTGVDEDDQLVLMVESKFWATLTRNQPVAYLDHLAPDKDGIVLFVAPASRFSTLWKELVQRCIESGLPVDKEIDQSPEYFVAKVGPRKLIGLASWESLLSYLKQELAVNNISDGEYEVWQLQGLCERLDAEAFRPLRPEDLQLSSDERIEQYCLLVDDLVGMLVKKGYASTEGYRVTPGADYYKRYMNLYGNMNWCIEYNKTYWTQFQPTPIWLTVTINSTTQSVEKLNLLRQKSPSRLFENKKQILIPLNLSVDIEREDVLENLVQQIEEFEPYIGV